MWVYIKIAISGFLEETEELATLGASSCLETGNSELKMWRSFTPVCLCPSCPAASIYSLAQPLWDFKFSILMRNTASIYFIWIVGVACLRQTGHSLGRSVLEKVECWFWKSLEMIQTGGRENLWLLLRLCGEEPVCFLLSNQSWACTSVKYNKKIKGIKGIQMHVKFY